MDTATKYVFDDYLQNKDEVHDKISWFLDTYITALRGERVQHMKLSYYQILVRRTPIKLSRHAANMGASSRLQLVRRLTIMHSQNVFSVQLEKCHDVKCYSLIVRKSYGKIAFMLYGY